VTGAVQTRGQTYFDDWILPQGSLYTPIKETIGKRARGDDGVARMSLERYASEVVSEIVAGKTGKIWVGNNAGGVKFSSTWLPQGMMVGPRRITASIYPRSSLVKNPLWYSSSQNAGSRRRQKHRAGRPRQQLSVAACEGFPTKHRSSYRSLE
jgi:hypothetical protein